jgi:hypothetical protein
MKACEIQVINNNLLFLRRFRRKKSRKRRRWKGKNLLCLDSIDK